LAFQSQYSYFHCSQHRRRRMWGPWCDPLCRGLGDRVVQPQFLPDWGKSFSTLRVQGFHQSMTPVLVESRLRTSRSSQHTCPRQYRLSQSTQCLQELSHHRHELICPQSIVC
jgi:hypothetical protein